MALIIGLTGGIASGKSTVANMLKEIGIPVVDADKIAREALEVGKPAYEEVVRTFGREILTESFQIDRGKLGEIVFNNEEKRMLLNEIVHPAVRKEMLIQKEILLQSGFNTIVLDIPLLFESNLTHLVDKILLVYVDAPIQLQRLMVRNHFSKKEALARIQSQMPLADKIKLADMVINNNGSFNETKQQLMTILTQWKEI